jgi:hypothetical protein
MVQTVCLSCILFTLDGREAKANKYIPIFLIWLSEVVRSAGLGPLDKLQIFADSDTHDYLTSQTPFFSVIGKLPCQVHIQLLPTPKSVLEGMMWKYLSVDYTQDVYFYCDIDCLIVKPIHVLIDKIPKGALWIQPEGPLRQHDWGAAFSEEELRMLPQEALGFSAGKFILHGKGQQQLLFAAIQDMCKKHTGETYYTVEQPFFNKAVLTTNHGFSIDLGTLYHTVSFNGRNYNPQTVFLDMAGEPGNADVHLEKMIYILCLRYTGVYIGCGTSS